MGSHKDRGNQIYPLLAAGFIFRPLKMINAAELCPDSVSKFRIHKFIKSCERDSLKSARSFFPVR